MIEIAEYDPAWPAHFASLRDHYASALSDVEVVAIEHVGSTAVPGLAAKPIIDVDIVVQRDRVDAAIKAMQAIGFTLVGTRGIDDRWALDEPAGLPPTNTYVIVEDSLALRNHLGVRDALRNDPSLRDEYAEVKRALAAATSGMADYTERKSIFLTTILELAGLTSAELHEIADANRA